MANEIMSVAGQLVGMPLAGPESFSQQQLDYLKRALGVDETVLWEDSNGIYLNNDSAVLSETINNFESVAIYAEGVYGGPLKKYEFIVISGGQYRFVTESLDGSDLLNVYFNVNITGTAVTVSRSKLLKISYSSSAITCSDLSATGTYKSKIKKVVGIHRISGGN